jgi:DNA-binding transcriptional MocR family regulator
VSYQAVESVIKHSQATNSDRLVLLVIAARMGADGTGGFPALRTIAKEARLGRSTVWTSLRELERTGELVEEERKPSGTRSFRLGARFRRPSSDPEPSREARSGPKRHGSSPEPRRSDHERGSSDHEPEPVPNRSWNRSRTKAARDQQKENGQHRIADPVEGVAS